MQHLLRRINERVTDKATANSILDVTLRKVEKVPPTGRHAILVGRVAFQDVNPDQNSNGDMAVVIVENSFPVTFMWRRSNQPWTPAALRVDSVVPHKVTQ